MRSESSRDHRATDLTQPIARLKWEHVWLLDEFGSLALSANRGIDNFADFVEKMAIIMKFLERHQEAEERFLFPLVAGLGDGLFKGLRKDHLKFLLASDSLVSSLESGTQKSLAESIEEFRIHLETHFTREESAIFEISADLLSPAQMDILRIKFASREAPEI